MNFRFPQAFQKNNSADLAAIHSRRQSRIFLLYGGIAVALLIALFFLYLGIKTSVDQITVKNAQYKTTIQGLNTIAELNRDRARAESALATIHHSLPTAIDIPTQVMPELRALANAARVDFNFTIGNERAGNESSPAAVEVSLDARGSLDGVMSFFKAVETHKRVLKVSYFDITRNSNGRYTLTLSALAYIVQAQP